MGYPQVSNTPVEPVAAATAADAVQTTDALVSETENVVVPDTAPISPAEFLDVSENIEETLQYCIGI